MNSQTNVTRTGRTGTSPRVTYVTLVTHVTFLTRSFLFAVILFLVSSRPLHANVYATHILLNGGTTNVSLPPSGNLTISYILNEPATLGVAIDVKSGTNTARTLTFTNGIQGALQG